jgi:hypothetical protein
MTPPFLPHDGVERLTLRDHFAMVALKELIAIYPAETAEKKALEAYQIADAMMRQRSRVPSGLP